MVGQAQHSMSSLIIQLGLRILLMPDLAAMSEA